MALLPVTYYPISSAICSPFSTLFHKKRRIITILVLIWSTSIILSLPEAFMVSSAPFLNQRDLFPCVKEDILWDLTSCVPVWSKQTGFIVTIIKSLLLYLFPLICMILLYKDIIRTLWRTKVEGGKFILQINLNCK